MSIVYVITDNEAGEGGRVISVHATLDGAKSSREGQWVDAGDDTWSLDYDTHDYYLIELFEVTS